MVVVEYRRGKSLNHCTEMNNWDQKLIEVGGGKAVEGAGSRSGLRKLSRLPYVICTPGHQRPESAISQKNVDWRTWSCLRSGLFFWRCAMAHITPAPEWMMMEHQAQKSLAAHTFSWQTSMAISLRSTSITDQSVLPCTS